MFSKDPIPLVVPSVTGLDPQNIRNELRNHQKIIANANYNEPIHNMHCMSVLDYFKAPLHAVVDSFPAHSKGV